MTAYEGPDARPGPFVCARCHRAIALFAFTVGWRGVTFACVTNGGRIGAWAADREADIQQAQVFRSLLAERRAELCDLLDEQAIKLGRYEHSHDTAGVRRKRRRIKEIGAEVRDIDRMIHGLTGRLLGPDQRPGPGTH